MWENGETYKGKGEENLQSGLKPNSSYRLWIISKPMKLEKKLLPKPHGQRIYRSIFAIKDYSITQIPQLPWSNDENLEKKWKLQLCLCKP